MATTYDLLIKERITDTNLLRVLSRETMRFAKVSGAAPEQVTGAFGAIFDKLKLNIDTLPNFQSAILKAMNVSGASAGEFLSLFEGNLGQIEMLMMDIPKGMEKNIMPAPVKKPRKRYSCQRLDTREASM